MGAFPSAEGSAPRADARMQSGRGEGGAVEALPSSQQAVGRLEALGSSLRSGVVQPATGPRWNVWLPACVPATAEPLPRSHSDARFADLSSSEERLMGAAVPAATPAGPGGSASPPVNTPVTTGATAWQAHPTPAASAAPTAHGQRVMHAAGIPVSGVRVNAARPLKRGSAPTAVNTRGAAHTPSQPANPKAMAVAVASPPVKALPLAQVIAQRAETRGFRGGIAVFTCWLCRGVYDQVHSHLHTVLSPYAEQPSTQRGVRKMASASSGPLYRSCPGCCMVYHLARGSARRSRASVPKDFVRYLLVRSRLIHHMYAPGNTRAQCSV